jgi:hypothetical protein
MLFEGGTVNSIGRSKSMFKRRTGANVAQLVCNHRSKVAGRVVSEFHHFAWLTLENNHHARLI